MAPPSGKLLPALAAAFLCCSLAPVAQCGGGGGGGGGPQNYTSMFSFGDSLTDTGNLLVSSPLSNHIVGRYPYGITYFHRPTGRCSDGRLVVDFLGACVCVQRPYRRRRCHRPSLALPPPPRFHSRACVPD
jgi:hypothetical protein